MLAPRLHLWNRQRCASLCTLIEYWLLLLMDKNYTQNGSEQLTCNLFAMAKYRILVFSLMFFLATFGEYRLFQTYVAILLSYRGSALSRSFHVTANKCWRQQRVTVLVSSKHRDFSCTPRHRRLPLMTPSQANAAKLIITALPVHPAIRVY